MAGCANLNPQLRLRLDPEEAETVEIAMCPDQLRTADLPLLSASCQQVPADRMAAAAPNNLLRLLRLLLPPRLSIHRVFTLIGSVCLKHLNKQLQLP